MDMLFNNHINSLNNDNDKYLYMLSQFEILQEYAKDTVEQRVNVQSVFDVKCTTKSKRGDLFKVFTQKTENVNHTHYVIRCESCQSDNVMCYTNTGFDICPDCGVMIVSPAYELDYNEEKDMDKNINYSYKKENHFNEWVNQFQAKELTYLPPKLIDDLKIDLKKQKITKKSDITHKKIKEILKKLGYNKYYEHIPYITTILNGVSPPIMSKELEDKLRNMFHMVQKPFDKFCPGNRANFLSYSYVLYKFCELLSADEYLNFFPLLKSREKLVEHDKIWKLICNELRWEFIPTI